MMAERVEEGGAGAGSEREVSCGRCGRDLGESSAIFEHQERLAIRFRGGYASVFGDGNLVEADICQHCLNDVLGPWLRITEDDPFEPRKSLRGEPAGAWQEYQFPGERS